jgi:hypothetical protein
MPTRINSGGLRLTDASFKSEAPAYAETARSLAGRTAELYELASGAPAASGEPSLTPTNPQGLTGWDLSGPPWGSAILHPVCWVGGRSPDGVNMHQPSVDAAWERIYRSNKPALLAFHFWNRPHDKIAPAATAPLSILYWAFRSYRVSGAGTPTATARTWNRRLGSTRETGDSTTFTTTVADTSVVAGTTLQVAVHPGWNTVFLEVSLDTSGHTSMITCASLNVRVKRSH